MFDFKLNNNCNHRIINELLEIKGSFPNYYAQLKHKAVGNNRKIIIRDQNNIFKIDYQTIPFELGYDNVTVRFTNIGKSIEETYPKPYFYATYWTNKSDCPRCIEQNGLINDMSLNAIGKPKIIDGFESLIQKFKKFLITQLGSNYFNEEYGTNLIKLIGKPNTALTVLVIQQMVYDTVDFIIKQQSINSEALTPQEKLLKIDNFQLTAVEDNPKAIKVTFNLYNYAYQQKQIGLQI